jgi:hypothetical protein
MATMFHNMENTPEDKNHTPEREIVLRPMEGRKTLNGIGLVDPRLFKGSNKLNAIMGEDGLWFCRYDDGNVPETLRVKFTSVSKLLTHVKAYYEKRNIEIVEVKNKDAS